MSEEYLALDVIREVYAIDYVHSVRKGKRKETEKVRVIGYVFYYDEGETYTEVLENAVYRRFEDESRFQDVDRAWISESAKATTTLDVAEEIGLYTIETRVDEVRPERTFIGLRREIKIPSRFQDAIGVSQLEIRISRKGESRYYTTRLSSSRLVSVTPQGYIQFRDNKGRFAKHEGGLWGLLRTALS